MKLSVGSAHGWWWELNPSGQGVGGMKNCSSLRNRTVGSSSAGTRDGGNRGAGGGWLSHGTGNRLLMRSQEFELNRTRSRSQTLMRWKICCWNHSDHRFRVSRGSLTYLMTKTEGLGSARPANKSQELETAGPMTIGRDIIRTEMLIRGPSPEMKQTSLDLSP